MSNSAKDIRRGATISPCGKYRYNLTREWYDDRFFNSPAKITCKPPLIFVMLNPSTADAYEDDPTIRRCIHFARREGFEWLSVLNLYAGRATKPADLFRMDDPEGSENFKMWKSARHMKKNYGAEIVCAWGANRYAKDQAARFLNAMNGVELYCLGKTKEGHPKHPLYLPNNAELQIFGGTVHE